METNVIKWCGWCGWLEVSFIVKIHLNIIFHEALEWRKDQHRSISKGFAGN